jgi:hypothetical protein
MSLMKLKGREVSAAMQGTASRAIIQAIRGDFFGMITNLRFERRSFRIVIPCPP